MNFISLEKIQIQFYSISGVCLMDQKNFYFKQNNNSKSIFREQSYNFVFLINGKGEYCISLKGCLLWNCNEK